MLKGMSRKRNYLGHVHKSIVRGQGMLSWTWTFLCLFACLCWNLARTVIKALTGLALGNVRRLLDFSESSLLLYELENQPNHFPQLFKPYDSPL